MSQTQEQGFSLVSGLAAELSGEELKLPSLPESVMQIRNALSKPDYSVDELARLITPEPALVGSVLTMANSVAFRRSGNETTDLKISISRIGAQMVQTAATTFALRQLKEGAEFKQVEHLLAPEWSRAGRTAAATYLVAQKTRKARPDEALIVGLIHNIGRIYLLSRAPKYPELFESEDEVAKLLDSWHASVGKAIAEFWKLPESTALAVEQQDEISDAEECPTIVDVLTTGLATARLPDEPTPEETAALANRLDFLRIDLRESGIIEIVAEREDIRDQLGLNLA